MARFWVQESWSHPARVGLGPSIPPRPGQTRGKKITANRLRGSASGHTACLCARPRAPTDRALCTRAAPSPVLSPLLARQLGAGGGGSKMPRPKLLRGFICKANGAGGSGFPQAVKKGCIERPGWAERGGHGSLSPSASPQQTWPGSGSRGCWT